MFMKNIFKKLMIVFILVGVMVIPTSVQAEDDEEIEANPAVFDAAFFKKRYKQLPKDSNRFYLEGYYIQENSDTAEKYGGEDISDYTHLKVEDPSIVQLKRQLKYNYTDDDIYDEENSYYFIPKKPGITRVLCSYTDEDDDTVHATWQYIEVKKSFFNAFNKQKKIDEYKETLSDYKKNSKVDRIYFGDSIITGKCYSGQKVYVNIRGKKYRAKGKKGTFTLKNIPQMRIGTKLVIHFSDGKYKWTKKKTIRRYNLAISWKRIYKSHKKVKFNFSYLDPHDRVIIKIGKKKYTKIAKGKNVTSFTVKNVKLHMGEKVSCTIYNKFHQKLASKKTKVWFRSGVKVGDTIHQVKYIPGWNKPDNINSSTYDEQWCYDDDGDGISDSFLYFDAYGHVTSWQQLG